MMKKSILLLLLFYLLANAQEGLVIPGSSSFFQLEEIGDELNSNYLQLRKITQSMDENHQLADNQMIFIYTENLRKYNIAYFNKINMIISLYYWGKEKQKKYYRSSIMECFDSVLADLDSTSELTNVTKSNYPNESIQGILNKNTELIKKAEEVIRETKVKFKNGLWD